MMPPRDTPEGLVADMAQVLLVLLFIHPEAGEICLPRTWIAQWHRDLLFVLTQLRSTP